MIIEDGGKRAWEAGYASTKYGQPMLTLRGWIEYTEWYLESYYDGQRHAWEDILTEGYRKEQIENTKAIRAKFKAIKRTGEKE